MNSSTFMKVEGIVVSSPKNTVEWDFLIDDMVDELSKRYGREEARRLLSKPFDKDLRLMRQRERENA